MADVIIFHFGLFLPRDGCNCSFSFWINFCPFYPLPFLLNSPKKRNFKKLKNKNNNKNLEISSFYTKVPKIMIICYTAPEIYSA